MPIYTIRHETIYRYRRPVAFGEHRMMLRPRSDSDQRVLDFRLDVTPAPVDFREAHDGIGNTVTTARFDRAAVSDSLRFVSRVTVAQTPARLPAHTAPVLPTRAEESAARTSLEGWARLFAGHGSESAIAVAMNRAIDRGFRHAPRHEKGVQPPMETLALGSGTCRDFAVLMIAALARHGIRARFVSGYLYLPDDPPERTRGGNTHAWVEADVDGRRVDFDPSHGTAGNAGLIRVAVVARPADAAPLAGTWFGEAADSLAMEVSVKVREDHVAAA
ncbi:MAG: transglutaminase family protein [Bauldia sp.]|nr:transglutaminase family protein [Bauldia sp.]